MKRGEFQIRCGMMREEEEYPRRAQARRHHCFPDDSITPKIGGCRRLSARDFSPRVVEAEAVKERHVLWTKTHRCIGLAGQEA